MTHTEVNGVAIGKHPMVTMKAILNSRPTLPRYMNTWDVGCVTTHLGGLSPNDHLDLKVLSGKLAMLMALVAATRSSELAALDLRFRQVRAEGVTFTPHPHKEEVSRDPSHENLFRGFQRECIVNALKAFEKTTEHLRPQVPTGPNKLFLALPPQLQKTGVFPCRTQQTGVVRLPLRISIIGQGNLKAPHSMRSTL